MHVSTPPSETLRHPLNQDTEVVSRTVKLLTKSGKLMLKRVKKLIIPKLAEIGLSAHFMDLKKTYEVTKEALCWQ